MWLCAQVHSLNKHWPMQTQNSHNAGSIGWLGFELSVLHRLKFKSVALPLAGEPGLGLYLKRWNARVAANDPAQWAWISSEIFPSRPMARKRKN